MLDLLWKVEDDYKSGRWQEHAAAIAEFQREEFERMRAKLRRQGVV